MKCDIIMVTWNEPAMTRRALQSIRDNSDYPYRLIIIDNNSDPETVRLLENASRTAQFGEMVLVRNKKNVGWVKAANQGFDLSSAEYVCLMNNDILAGPGWLRNMVHTVESTPNAGIADPEGNDPKLQWRADSIDTYARELAGRNCGDFIEVESCSGFCMLVKRCVIDDIGVFDEIYESGYGEDADYCRRAIKAGYRCIRCNDAFVLHLGSRSFRKVPELQKRMHERNLAIFEERWGKKKRLLILLHYSAGDDLLEMARRRYLIYVVRNRYVNPDTLPCRHVNIQFRGSGLPLFGGGLYFLLKTYYLKARGKIDAAFIVINRAGLCEITGSKLSKT